MEIDVDVLEKDINTSVDSEVLNASATEENIVNASVEKENVIDCSVKKNIVKAESDNTNVVNTGGGTTDHSKLNNLDYENSGHTGFASKDDVHSEITIGEDSFEFNDNQELTDFIYVQVSGAIEDLHNRIDNVSNRIPSTSQFITRWVTDLVNYYTKSETYTKTEVNDLISSIKNVRFEIVNQLPTTAETNVIYLLKVSEQEKNYYDEYIFINGAWELIGNTKIDLTGYATEDWVNKAIKDFLTESQVNTLIATALSGYVTSEELAEMGFLTEKDLETKNYITETELTEKNYVTGENLASKNYVTNQMLNDKNFVQQSQLQEAVEESLPTFNRDFNIKNEDGVVKTFTNTGTTIDDKYIFTQILPTTNLYTEVIFTANEYTIVYGKGYNFLYLSRNGIDFERKDFSVAIKNIIRIIETNRLIALCNGGYFYYSDDDGVTWDSTQVSTYSTYDKVVNYLEYTDTFGVVQLSTKTLHFLNNKFTRNDYLTSAITPNFTTMLNQSQIMWCDYNGNCRYKAGSREGNVTSLPTGRVSFLGRVNGVVYGGYQNDNKIAYLNGTSTTSSWGTYTLPETCTVNDIIYNAKDQTYYILTDINTYYKTKDFITFESFEKDNIRIAKGTMTLVGLMGVSNVNAKYVYVAPTQQKIEDTLQELKRAVNKEKWVGKGLELDGEVINVKGNNPIMINDYGINLMWRSLEVGYFVPEQAEVIMSGGSYRHNLVPETVMDEIWNIWDGTPEQVVNVMFTSSGSFYDPMSWETEYFVEKGEYGYLISDTYGSAMPYKKTGSLAPFLN